MANRIKGCIDRLDVVFVCDVKKAGIELLRVVEERTVSNSQDRGHWNDEERQMMDEKSVVSFLI